MGVGGGVHLYDIVLESSRSLSHLLMLLSIDNNAINVFPRTEAGP